MNLRNPQVTFPALKSSKTVPFIVGVAEGKNYMENVEKYTLEFIV